MINERIAPKLRRLSAYFFVCEHLCCLPYVVQELGGKVNAVVPLQCPIGKGELNKLTVVAQLFAELASEQRFEINDASLAVAKLQFHCIVVQIFHIDHSKQFLIFHTILF